ncbi:MAG: ImmA/IrrE family metallo-endopeptidase [Syntrophomonadaceae bacterium]|nr:ImmA/IrrE family metallo-endopeptidase [Syntrophomonadaceae bacterium]MDD3889905.1 ImmA/IrrE family metallo-endopeptidase [Syntrophomonadaceae bacterium]MDD4549872.1 ImmA/IrrE family metallo-endopeptidase [Syntrophomonadaceae bacterium]
MSRSFTGVPINDLRDQAEDRAERLRNEYVLGIRNIPDLFRFTEQTLGYFLIRYPFGKEAIEGFAAIYQGRRLLVTNSSHIFSRERFTLAHEIAHHLFDLEEDKQAIESDKETGQFNEQNPLEYRADCFAAAFLMPQKGIRDSLRELRIDNNDIGFFDIIRLQVEFGVSYRAMVRRLKDLGIITYNQAQTLRDYFGETGHGLESLFKRVNASKELLHPSETVWIPTKYMNYLIFNYENGHIPYSALSKVLEIVNLTPEAIGLSLREEKPFPEEVDIDQLIQELENEV